MSENCLNGCLTISFSLIYQGIITAEAVIALVNISYSEENNPRPRFIFISHCFIYYKSNFIYLYFPISYLYLLSKEENIFILYLRC